MIEQIEEHNNYEGYSNRRALGAETINSIHSINILLDHLAETDSTAIVIETMLKYPAADESLDLFYRRRAALSWFKKDIKLIERRIAMLRGKKQDAEQK